jgi:hypothetical protein
MAKAVKSKGMSAYISDRVFNGVRTISDPIAAGKHVARAKKSAAAAKKAVKEDKRPA